MEGNERKGKMRMKMKATFIIILREMNSKDNSKIRSLYMILLMIHKNKNIITFFFKTKKKRTKIFAKVDFKIKYEKKFFCQKILIEGFLIFILHL